MIDVIIIGAGVLGCALAHELSRYKLDVAVLERAHDVGEGSSKANSGIVHVGFHPRGGSLKGTSCVRGHALLKRIANELGVELVHSGGLMVAFNEEGITKLEEKAERARLNGAGHLPIVTGDEARRLEPRLSPKVVAAMIAEETHIISPFHLVLALAENASDNGVVFRFNSKVIGADRRNDVWQLHLEQGECITARFVVNMAGDGAMELDAAVGGGDYKVKPRAGDYLVFAKQDPSRAITHVIYQAAETDEGGTLLAPTVDGNLLAGPTSRNVRDFDRDGSSDAGLRHIERVARKLIPDLDFSQVIRNFAGVRTNITNVSKELKDFVVRPAALGFISALGIKNPGLTASPALAQLALRLLEEEGLRLEPNPAYSVRSHRFVPFLQHSAKEQASLLRSDSSYDRIVCRCEGITEGDVRALFLRPLPPTTLAGVKRRLRCGMGRCQGSFCEPRLIEVIARIQGIDPWQVRAGEHNARIVLRAVK